MLPRDIDEHERTLVEDRSIGVVDPVIAGNSSDWLTRKKTIVFRLSFFEFTVMVVEKIRRANSRWWTGLSVLQKRAWMKSLEDISWDFAPNHCNWHVTDRRKRWERSPMEYPLTKCIDGSVDNCWGILRSTSFDWHTRSPREWIRMHGSEESSRSLLH